MQELTPRQQEVVAYIAEEIQTQGRPPTLREMAAHFGWQSDNAARQHLRLLEKKGALELNAHRSRGIRLLHAPGGGVPLVGKVSAGQPLEAIENVEGHIHLDPELFPEEDVFALRVRGDSMIQQGIHDGDIAIIRKQETAVHNEIVIALLNGEATLKRYRQYGRQALLHAENPAYKDIRIKKTDAFEILGVAIGILRRF